MNIYNDEKFKLKYLKYKNKYIKLKYNKSLTYTNIINTNIVNTNTENTNIIKPVITYIYPKEKVNILSGGTSNYTDLLFSNCGFNNIIETRQIKWIKY